MKLRKRKIRFPASPWRHGVGRKSPFIDVVDARGEPIFGFDRPYDEEVETTRLIVHAINAVFAVAKRENIDPLEAAIEIEMRAREVTREEVMKFSDLQKGEGVSLPRISIADLAEKNLEADRELAIR